MTDFGVTGDGVTDDTSDMLDAISFQQSSGCVLEGVEGGNIRLATWTAPTLANPFYWDGRWGTVTCANSTAVAFATFKSQTLLSNTTWVDWYRIVDNPTGTTGTLDGFWFFDNIVSGTRAASDNFAYPILLRNDGVQNVFIHDNVFTNVLVAAIQVGDNSYAAQPNWRNICITDNTIDGVTIPNGPSQIFGIIVFGTVVLIEGNVVRNVQVAPGDLSSSNGAYGIYVKSTFCRVANNHVQDIGTTETNVNADATEIIAINLKGFDRGQTEGPVGYAQVAIGNTVDNVGGTSIGVGISCNHLGVTILGNWIERTGWTGIAGGNGTGSATDSIKVQGNTVIMRAGTIFAGIDVQPSTGSMSLIGNTVDGVGGPCIRVRAEGAAFANGLISGNQLIGSAYGIYASSDTFDVTNLNVIGNVLVSGSYGFYANNGGGTFHNVTVMDNDFSAASTAGCGGNSTLLAACRIRNNKGYVSENGGISASISTGGTIAHGLALAPGGYSVTPVGTATITSVTANATNLIVNFSGGPAAFAWEAKIPAYWSA